MNKTEVTKALCVIPVGRKNRRNPTPQPDRQASLRLVWRADTAGNLAAAMLWFRRYPELVASGVMPAELEDAYQLENGNNPLEAFSIGDDALRPDFEQRIEKQITG